MTNAKNTDTPKYAHYPSLEDRQIFITGGAAGIGASLVALFADQGAKVAFADINAEGAQEVIAKCAGATHEPLFFEVDMRDIDALQDAIRSASEKMGGLKVLINNAANDDRHDWKNVSSEYWDNHYQVNFKHQFFAIQAAAPLIAEQGGGSIVNMGSACWLLQEAMFPAYATAKSAVQGLTTTMARSLGPDNINVNTVLPGWVFTERQLEKWWTPEGEAASMDRQCIRRRLYPDEHNQMILWLAADDGSACTAQSFIIDLGRAGI